MIADLKPYPAYRESGLLWLGKVPEHWDVKRLKLLLREVDCRSSTGKEQLLRVSQYTGVTVRKSMDGTDLPDSRAASLIGYKRVMPNDLVINIMLAWNGSMGVSRYEGIASPAYCVYRFNSGVLPLYYHELLRIPLYKGRIKATSTGVVESRLRLYSDDLGCIEAILPPLDEQAAIVGFLGWANGQLEKAIRAKRRVITLLNEQKQAIIHRAVTRGLDPSVPLKPSGIPWLGDIPEHWDAPLNQRVFREQIRPHGDLPELQLSLSQRDGLIATKDMQERSLQTASFDNWKVTLPGDLVLNRFKAHLGVFFASTLRGIVSFHYGVFAPRRELYSKYFELLFHTYPYRTIYAGRSNGMTVGLQNLSNQNFYSVRCLVPPVQEQLEIVAHIERETETLNTAISRFEREIELLREYRTRLVADVVTGKLDVREAAAKLPDEVQTLEFEDDLAALEEDVDSTL
ncbi:MAG: hypothetical protein ACOYOE_08725 [Chlorobium sp.]